MVFEQDCPIHEVKYEKPVAVDLGLASPVVGASCVSGDEVDITGDCDPLGNAATNMCWNGASASGFGCLEGDSADQTCSDGNAVV